MNHRSANPTNEQLWIRATRCGLPRRQFLQLLAAGGPAAVLTACRKMEAPAGERSCIVVGSGPVGIAAALRLAEQAVSVLVLEAGPSITDPAGSHFRNQPAVAEVPDGYFAAIGPYLEPLGEQPDSVLPGLADTRLHGGQGILWTNNCPRAQAFELWPALSPEEWDRRYTEAETLLQVLPDPAADSTTGGNVAAKLRDVIASGRTVRGLPLAGRYRGDGSVHFHAPWDMLAAAAPDVRARVEIRSGIGVTAILHEGGRVSGVVVRGPDDIEQNLPASALLIAGGAVGTPKLLHRSGIRPDALGRGFSFHALLFGQVVLDTSLSAPASTAEREPRLWIPPTEAAPWHIQVLRDTYPVPTTEAVDNPHRLVEFQAFLPMEFRDENRFVFQDDDGVGVRFDVSEGDRSRMRSMEQDVRALAAHLGPWRGGGGELAFVPPGTAHLVGTCRMDLPDWSGVADDTGTVHGFENLYLATVGLIPAPVAVNPTLTAVALALNTADTLVRTL